MIRVLQAISILLLLSFTAPFAYAQEKSLMDSVVENVAVDDEYDYDYDEGILPDTTISFVEYSPDTTEALKRSPDFSYLQNLDSLLKVTKGLKADTVNMQEMVESKRNRKNDLKDTEVPKTSSSILSSPGISVFLWILAVLFILFILYKLFFSEGLFKKEKIIRKTDVEDEQERPVTLSDYEIKIRDAMKAGNYRLAVRYLYLQTLNKLNQAGQIHYAAEKTNYQYVREVYNKPYRNEFAALTLNYEYVWYGNFDLDENLCMRLQEEFNQFNRKF